MSTWKTHVEDGHPRLGDCGGDPQHATCGKSTWEAHVQGSHPRQDGCGDGLRHDSCDHNMLATCEEPHAAVVNRKWPAERLDLQADCVGGEVAR